MGYWTRTVGGLLLIAAGLGVFGYSLAELIEGGTCSSGGPYVSSRPCPENTALYIVLLFPSLIAFLAGGAMFVGRGRRSVKPGLPPQGGSVTANPPSFGSAGLASSEGPSLLEGMAAIRDAAVKQSLGRTDSAAPRPRPRHRRRPRRTACRPPPPRSPPIRCRTRWSASRSSSS